MVRRGGCREGAGSTALVGGGGPHHDEQEIVMALTLTQADSFQRVSGAMVGADVNALRNFASYIQGTLSTAVSAAFNDATKQIPNIQWVGNDATQFVSAWNQMLAQITSSLNGTFESLETSIKAQAQQQETASA